MEKLTKKELAEFCANFANFMKECNFESFDNLMHILRKLPLLKIREGYELDAFQKKLFRGYIFQAYCCKVGATEHYVPTQVKDVVETVKSDYLFGLFSKTKNITVTKEVHIPYDDSLRIHGMIGMDEGNDIPEVLSYFDVPFTENAIIQAWFLQDLTAFMPRRILYKRKFLFDIECFKEEVEETLSSDPVLLEEFLKVDLENLLPEVKIQGECAVIEYAYWHDRFGLVKSKETVTKDGNTVKFSELEETTVLKYCDIIF